MNTEANMIETNYSSSWVEHARGLAELAVKRFPPDGGSYVVEVACHDGDLLRQFAAAEIPVLGIQPAANVAATQTQSSHRSDFCN